MKSGRERFLSLILSTIIIWIDCLHFDNDNNNNNNNKTNNCEDKSLKSRHLLELKIPINTD